VGEPIENRDEAKLLADLAAGLPAAFARLYGQFGARLYRTALAILGRREDAEDAVQEVFMAVVRSRARLADVRDLSAYLFVSLRRAAARHRERRAGAPVSSAQVDEAVAAQGAAEDPRSDALRRALGSLTPEQREVIALKIHGELTFAEIARVLETNANTVASRYRYAIERLRSRLQE
jgi:RNA polymerase sigma-70 factor (ECF subfamily)